MGRRGKGVGREGRAGKPAAHPPACHACPPTITTRHHPICLVGHGAQVAQPVPPREGGRAQFGPGVRSDVGVAEQIVHGRHGAHAVELYRWWVGAGVDGGGSA